MSATFPRGAPSPRKKPATLRRSEGQKRQETLRQTQGNIAAAADGDDGQVDDSPQDSGRSMEGSHAEGIQLPGEHSSSLHLSDDPPEHDDSLDERKMHRHFMDVESSFLPEAAPQQPEAPVGVDDTYLELGNAGRTSPDGMLESEADVHTGQFTSQHAETQQDSAPEYSDDKSGDSNDDADFSFSSPAHLAALRGYARVGTTGARSRPDSPSSPRPVSKGSTIRPQSSPRPQDVALPGSTTNSPKGTLPRPSRLNARPLVSHRRRISERSATSSNTLSSDRSGTDDALETELNPGLLQRLPSFGSAASYLDRDSDTAPSLGRDISGASLLASMRGAQAYSNESHRPETPRAKGIYPEAPTDTVIAKHVQSIQVPETIARDFRARNRSLSPNKRPTSAGQGGGTFQGQPRKALTLKEQNSKIDKLTKENFDLKLKIHFLDQALQNRSEDGVKDLIDRNVQFQTDLANERKESQSMRRKIRELERKIQEQEERLAESQRQNRSEDSDPTLQGEMHEEILYLRQQLDHSENRVTTLTEEVMTKELEKRKMAEHMRSMATSRGKDSAGLRETESMWQDLLQAEQGRREQAEEDARKLREELMALRIDRASPVHNRAARRKGRMDADDNDIDLANGASSGASSVVIDQLRHENAELRRDLGAQTSMLTSRNRERERLQQEIEDLKLLQRKGDGARSVAGESIFERSISRAHQRAPSRASEAVTAVTEAERDDWEKKEGMLRDQNAELRLKYQELERTHNTHLQYITTLESDFREMENELNEGAGDLRALQVERDEALQAYEDKESEYEKLERDALAEIENLEHRIEILTSQLEESHKRHQKIQSKLEHTSDAYKGLQGELREITNSVLNLGDEKQANLRTIQTLEQQLSETETELQKWEQKCKEIDEKNRKLEITLESLHSEITFLREEQEGDKIKIGELEDALSAAQQTIQDEQEKLREMEEGIVEERQQRDVLENNSREEVQKVVDDLNKENGRTKDEVRKLRRGLSAKEVEAAGWKQKLDELEQSLRHALGDPEGSRQSLLAEIEKLQRDLETTASSLDRTKMELADKDRLLRHRDGLLETTSLESRRLSDLLDKEVASRKHDLEQYEKATRGQATHMRTVAQQETRRLELESAYIQDKRKMAALEEQYREQLYDRNTLLLALWNRLSTLCGTDWAQGHSLVNGQTPSVDVIGRHLPAFNKNIIAALKTVEGVIGSFKVRIRSIEKELWKDYQTLQHNLDIRMRRVELLEKKLQDAQEAATIQASMQRPQSVRATSGKSSEEISRLKSEIKFLKTELKQLRQHPSERLDEDPNEPTRRGSSAGSVNAKSQTSPARQFVSNLLRHHSSSAVEQIGQDNLTKQVPSSAATQQPVVFSASGSVQPSEQRWVHRLKELEKRLKAEREARLLDRQGARQRLEEGRLENEELKQLLEHERMRSGVALSDRRESDDNASGVD